VTQDWPLQIPRLPLLADIEGISLEENNSMWISEIPKELMVIISEIAILDGGCWLVGGAVRELLSGNLVNDWDLATTIHPLELSSHLDSLGLNIKIIHTGIKYGTFTIIWPDIIIEVTTLRTDASYSDGRRPEEVFFGNSLKDDLDRRDFTVNSMAIDLSRGILYDPHNGLLDLNNMILRAVGNPRRRIAEDGLRLLRAYRFIERGDHGLLNLDRDLHDALLKEQWMIDKISKERIWSELQKIFKGKHAGEIIWLMIKHQMFDQLFGESFSVDDVGVKAQSEACLFDKVVVPEFRLGLLYYNRTSEDLEKACEKLSLSKKQRKRAHLSHKMLGNTPSHEDRGMLRLWRYFLGASFEVQLLLELALSKEIGTEQNMMSLITELSELPPLRAGRLPLVNGIWLMEKTGIVKGEKLGRLKEWLHKLQIERDLIDLEQVLDILATISWDNGDHLDWPRIEWI
jgi:tRNA nucleotidyltransferase (CCA-adding enzyme)